MEYGNQSKVYLIAVGLSVVVYGIKVIKFILYFKTLKTGILRMPVLREITNVVLIRRNDNRLTFSVTLFFLIFFST